jgi:inorganic pyrophosphatase
MPNLAKLPTWAGPEVVHAVIETPRGARAKLDFDPEFKTFVLKKPLTLGLSYPYDFGFIPSTNADDGDPLDVMVIHDAQTCPGLVVRCKLTASCRPSNRPSASSCAMIVCSPCPPSRIASESCTT